VLLAFFVFCFLPLHHFTAPPFPCYTAIMNIIQSPSPNFNERQCTIDMLVVHYTDMPTAKEALAWMINPESQVSAHYLIDEQGQITQLVEEAKRAWHAGGSFWQGVTDLNSSSIGIELANPGHTCGYRPFPEAQLEAFLALAQEIQIRWEIPSSRILGHSDIAPQRKQDPGHLFPWKQLAERGFGLWPEPIMTGNEEDPADLLAKVGYDVTSAPHAILAFQRHFQPHKLDGITDQETLALLQGLLKLHTKPI